MKIKINNYLIDLTNLSKYDLFMAYINPSICKSNHLSLDYLYNIIKESDFLNVNPKIDISNIYIDYKSDSSLYLNIRENINIFKEYTGFLAIIPLYNLYYKH